jgi:hypothetical protein
VSARPGPGPRPRSADLPPARRLPARKGRQQRRPASSNPSLHPVIGRGCLGRRRRPAGTAQGRLAACARSTSTPGHGGWSPGHRSGVLPSAPRHPPGEGAARRRPLTTQARSSVPLGTHQPTQEHAMQTAARSPWVTQGQRSQADRPGRLSLLVLVDGLEVVVEGPGGEPPPHVPGGGVGEAEVEPVPHPSVDDVPEQRPTGVVVAPGAGLKVRRQRRIVGRLSGHGAARFADHQERQRSAWRSLEDCVFRSCATADCPHGENHVTGTGDLLRPRPCG